MTSSATAAINVAKLEVGYSGLRVLHGVDLTVAPGEFIAILGSSGCGKTTLLRTIAGFQKASGGSIKLFGRDVVDVAAGEARHRHGVPVLCPVAAHDRARQCRVWPAPARRAAQSGGPLAGRRRCCRCSTSSGLEDRKVTNLSGGQRQRVALGRALAIEPDCCCSTSRSPTSTPRSGCSCARDQVAAEPARLHGDPRHA